MSYHAWASSAGRNAVASPFAQDQTVVMGIDDSTPGQVYVYVGQKQAAGTAVEKAGLTNGNLYGIAVNGFTPRVASPGWVRRPDSRSRDWETSPRRRARRSRPRAMRSA
jgi:hypothetical protein